jgi:hypothetical protein
MRPIKHHAAGQFDADGNAKADLSTGPSPIIWDSCPWESIVAGRVDGFVFFDDFITLLTTVDWTITQATAGTAAPSDAVGGVALLDCNSTTADQGIQMQGISEAFQPLAGVTIFFECRLKVTDTIAGAQFFAGLAQEDTTVFAAGANTTDNHIGFEMNALTQAGTVGTAGTANFYGEKATARNTAAADAGLDVHLFVEDTYVKLGFVIDGITEARVYVDGADTMDRIVTANIPTAAAGIMTPTFVCQNEDGATDPIVSLDWVRVAQLGPRPA